MSSDANFIIPSDYYINSQRSDYNDGEVGTATKNFLNGTKIGNYIPPDYKNIVFEPINEFKGDFARMHLYFITRYESRLPSFYALNKPETPYDGSTYKGFTTCYLQMLLRWATQDPVSQKEIDRNKAVYVFQGSRNPLIVHPEWISKIWTSNMSTDDLVFSKNYKIYPNPLKSSGTISVDGKNLQQYTKK